MELLTVEQCRSLRRYYESLDSRLLIIASFQNNGPSGYYTYQQAQQAQIEYNQLLREMPVIVAPSRLPDGIEEMFNLDVAGKD